MDNSNCNQSGIRLGSCADAGRVLSPALGGGGGSNTHGESNHSATQTKENNMKNLPAEEATIALPPPPTETNMAGGTEQVLGTRGLKNANDTTQVLELNGESKLPFTSDHIMDEPFFEGASAVSNRVIQDSNTGIGSPEPGSQTIAPTSSQTIAELPAIDKIHQHATSAAQQENPPGMAAFPETPRRMVTSDGPLPGEGLRNNTASQAGCNEPAEMASLPTTHVPAKVGSVASAGPLPGKGLRGHKSSTQGESVVPLARSRKVGETPAGQVPPPDSVPGTTALNIPGRRLGDRKSKGKDSSTRSISHTTLGPSNVTHTNMLGASIVGQVPPPEPVPGVNVFYVPRRRLGDRKAKAMDSPTPPITSPTLETPDVTPNMLGESIAHQEAQPEPIPEASAPASVQMEFIGNQEPLEGPPNTPGAFETSNQLTTHAPGEQDGQLNSTPERRDSSSDVEMSRHGALVEATLVAEDMDHENANNLQMAEEVDHEMEEKKALERRNNRCPCWAKTVFVCVVLGILIVVIMVVAPNGGGSFSSEPDNTLLAASDVPSLTPSEPPTLSLRGYVESLLPSTTLVTISEHPDSPQAMAYDWLMKDPFLSTYSSSRIIQRFALVVTFYSTGGPSWRNNSNWLHYEHHECSWHAADALPLVLRSGIMQDLSPLYNEIVLSSANQSVACQDSDDHQAYTHLLLVLNNLHGSLPPELYMLTSLRGILLAPSPGLTGPGLPTQIGMLTSLETLLMTGAQLTGAIPSQIALLSNLHTLHFGYNMMSGPIPSQLALLSNSLKILDFFENHITGTIPTVLGSLQEVILFNFHDNNIYGTLPSELGRLESVSWMSLSKSSLGGSIPSELGKLQSLKELYLYSNSLTGPVPQQLGNLVNANGKGGNLHLLFLYNNVLSGSIPKELCSIETVTEAKPQLQNQSLVGCPCNCTFVYDEGGGTQLCSPSPNRCSY